MMSEKAMIVIGDASYRIGYMNLQTTISDFLDVKYDWKVTIHYIEKTYPIQLSTVCTIHYDEYSVQAELVGFQIARK
jgi:hypothetical protein